MRAASPVTERPISQAGTTIFFLWPQTHLTIAKIIEIGLHQNKKLSVFFFVFLFSHFRHYSPFPEIIFKYIVLSFLLSSGVLTTNCTNFPYLLHFAYISIPICIIIIKLALSGRWLCKLFMYYKCRISCNLESNN